MLDLLNTAVEKLTALGVKPGDRVVISCEGCPEFAITVVALWKIGAVAVPVNPCLPKSLADELFSSIGASGVLDRAGLKEIIKFDKSTLHFCPFASLGLDLDAEASILFTSASTGIPKAVVHTIGNHYYSALGSAENIPFASNDCWGMSLPMYHISGFSLLMRALVSAASIYLTDDPLQKAISQNNITHISLVPTQLQRLMKNLSFPRRRESTSPDLLDSLAKLKAILLGGGAIPQSLLKVCKDLNLPVHTTYGLTELASQVVTDSKVLPYRELMIAGDGEILVKGKTLFKGYLREGKIELPVDANGYFATGDIGLLDADGNLQITGRKDLMFISGGENIYPEQIERVMCDIENIVQAVVVPIDDAEFGQRPVAFIQTCDRTQFDSEHLKELLCEKLESFKIPVKFYPMVPSKTIKPNRKLLSKVAQESL